MKYLQLEIAGVKRGFKFGLGFLGELMHAEKTDLEGVINNLNENILRSAPLYMFYSYKFNQETKGELPKLTRFDFIDLIENDPKKYDADFVIEWTKAFFKSIQVDLKIEVEKNEESEKKNINWTRDVISYAIGELACPSLDYVYEMTYSEFQIRAFSYKRIERKRIEEWRRTMYVNLISGYQDPKRIPKNEKAFMPLEGDEPNYTTSEKMKNKFLQAYKNYKNIVNGT